MLIATVMDGDGEWRQVKVCQCPGSGERESRAVCRDIAQIDEETNIGNNTQAQGREQRQTSLLGFTRIRTVFISFSFILFKKMAQSLKKQMILLLLSGLLCL